MLPDPSDFNVDDSHECKRCGEVKLRSAFGKDGRTSSGLRDWCRDCTNLYARDKRRETSSLSLIDAAVKLLYPSLPEDHLLLDLNRIQFMCGAPMKEIRLYIMRAYQELENQKLAALRAKNLAEFAEKQADKEAIAAADEAIRSKRV